MAKWTLDTAHTSANFSVKHMMFATVRGCFSGITGTIEFDPANLAAASVEAIIPAASVNTGVTDRDNHLRSPDFFDAANHPNLVFKSKKVVPSDATHAHIVGDLTIHGVTREVVLDAEFEGEGKNPWGKQVAAFTATTSINREDFGLTWNQVLETGGVLVGKDIKIELHAESVLVVEEATA